MFLDFESVHSYLPTGFAIFPPIISQKTCMTVCPFSSFRFFFGGGGRERISIYIHNSDQTTAYKTHELQFFCINIIYF